MSFLTRRQHRREEAVIPPAEPRIPDGIRVYAFGDVHGREDLVRNLLARIVDDAATDPAKGVLVIGLGDYVDRGPSSKGVIDALQNDFATAFHTVFLKGNHEAMLLDFLHSPLVGSAWLRAGGLECLLSYGVRCNWRQANPDELLRVRDELLDRMGPRHFEFLASLRASQIVGDYFFAHAGARPGISLASQEERDLLWIRKGFSDRDEPFEKFVVHGHTVGMEPFLGNHRINLDTGAYATGRLTCIALEADARRLMEVSA